MNIAALVAAGVVFSILALIVRNSKSEIAPLVSIGGSILIIAAIIPYVITIIQTMEEFASLSPLGESFLTPILKITGISYITQIGSDLCIQSGENIIASRVQAAGKIAIMVITIPIAKEAFTKIMGILT